MENYLNLIQLITGIIAVISIFSGLFLSVKKLNKFDKSEKIPQKTVIISTLLIAAGLLLYAAAKTCTRYANRDQEYEISVLYLSSLIEVVKYFGFILLIPFLFNFLMRKPNRKKDKDEDNG